MVYGVSGQVWCEGGQLRCRGGDGSDWWKNLNMIRDEIRLGIGCWLEESIVRNVGDWSSTLFWQDSWVEGGNLKT